MIGVPPPLGQDWQRWGESLKRYLEQTKRYIATSLLFDKVSPAPTTHGGLTWNPADDTLNIGHANGVIQQVGQEQYMRAKNDTGATLSNGEIVSFTGVNGDITVGKYIADGTIDNLYFIGVLTQDLPDGETGMVTIYGKVRGLDTSAWTTGTLLYASAATAGQLTSTRPTVPNEIVVVAAVLAQDATDGEIMVRPTIPIGMDYGDFCSEVDQTPASSNTAYPIKLGTTNITHGVSIEDDGSSNPTEITFASAGQYHVSVSLQVTSGSGSATTVYCWLRQNGTDVPFSRRDFSIRTNSDTKVLSTSFMITASVGDYLQIMWAGSTTNLTLDAVTATGFAPAAPSAIVTVSQLQL